MKKLTVLIDMDDTIEGLVFAWVHYVNEKFGTTVRPEDIDDWNMQIFSRHSCKRVVWSP